MKSAWIAIALLALAAPARADSDEEDTTESADKPAEKPADKPADDNPAEQKPPMPLAEYDPIPDEANLDSLWQRVDELYQRADAMLSLLSTPVPAR